MSNLTFLSIDIDNFKTFTGQHKFKLTQPPGLYYITGQNKVAPELGANGVGKSTIWDALLWVLWGRTGRDNRPADAIKPWAGKGRTAVGVHFNRDGKSTTILRQRNPNRLQLWQDGDAADMGKEITQDEVPKLLGMSEEMFRRTLVLGQFGTLFLDLKPEAQAQMFTEALGLDVWLRAIEKAGDHAKGSQRTADQAAANIATNDALLADLATQVQDQQAKANTWETDQRARIKKGDAGIASLENDLAEAQRDAPAKPNLPDDTKLAKLRTAASDARNAAADAQRDLDSEQRELKRATTKLEDLRTAKNCPTCGQPVKRASLAEHTKELEDEIETLQARIAKLTSKVATLSRARKAADDAVSDEVEDSQAARDAYEDKLDTYDKGIRKIASIQGELKRWRDNLAQVKAETNQAAAEVERLQKRRRTMRATGTTLKEQHEAALAEVETAKFWQDGFREIRLGIIDQTLVELEMATSRHAAMLGLNDWGIKFDTERETKAGTVSYAFSVLLYPPGQEQPVKWESYSGGESQRWQLATAFALSEVLLARAGLSPNIEVLDEPTKGLSGQGVQDLLEHLRDRALELGRAVYFVDHHSLDKGAFDGTLMITKDKKGSTFKWQ